MIYSEPLLWQLYNFLFFFGFGFLCGLLFRFIEFIRKIFSAGKAAVIAQDIIFSVVTTVLMFIFLLTYADGKVRLNLIFAAALGGAVFFITLGKVTERAFGFLSEILGKIAAALAAPFVVLSRFAKKFALKIFFAVKKSAVKSDLRKRKESPKNDSVANTDVFAEEKGKTKRKKERKKHR